MSQYVRIAAAYADAMLRERERTNHDAVPEAKATNDGGTPKDADGTGNTPSKAEIDAPLYALPVLRAEDEIAIEAAFERTGIEPTWPEDEAGCGVKYANAMAQEIERLRQFDRSQPIKPAEDTHATHATPCEGSLRGEGTLPNSYRENDEKRGVSDTKRGPVACSPTLTDEERAAIYRAEARLRTAYVPDDATAATLRKLLERLT
jgi:hypothetical protein